ncbi:glycosyltransferase family 4 protein [soil metagenome]
MIGNILWLPAWYPNKLAPFDGDFIQRHARAVAIFQPVTVIYVKKDENTKYQKNIEIDISIENNLTEIIIYYNPLKTGIRVIDRLLSQRTYKKIYRQVILKYIMENGMPPLVHVHVAWKAGIVALWLKKKFGVPYIISEHWSGYLQNTNDGVRDLYFFQRKSLESIIRNATKITVVSHILGKAISNHFNIPDYLVIPNTIDTSIFYPGKETQNDVKTFIHISNLKYPKNIFSILKSFAEIRTEGFHFKFLIYSQASAPLEKWIKEKGMEQYVALRNEVPQVELAEQIKLADALILYSKFETFGCVALEANACGIPVIVSDIPALRENIKEGEGGIFVDLDDSNALATTLKNFIKGNHQFDKQLMAKNAADRFNFEIIGNEFSKLYKEILRSQK